MKGRSNAPALAPMSVLSNEDNEPAFVAMSQDSEEIIAVGKTVKTTRKFTYMEEDESPEYLLPSNGGYNPKAKSIFTEEIHVEEEKKVIKKPKKKQLDYVQMMKGNIRQMRHIHGEGGRQRETLQNVSKNHL